MNRTRHLRQKISSLIESVTLKNKEIDELKNYLDKSEVTKNLKNIPNDTLFTLDRYEGKFAVCENRTTGKMTHIPNSIIPISAKDGDILKFENDKFKIDISETKKQNNLIQNLFKDHTENM